MQTAGARTEVAFDLSVKNPEPWSTETPNLYTARIRLTQKGGRDDVLSIPFGIRTIRFSTEKGFELNGVPMLLKGGCLHHDNGLLGAASFDRAEERKIELLKNSGFNAVRGSHNPMSESFMNACDRLGMLVVDEAFDQWQRQKNPDDYHRYFDEWSARDIRALILRDRNRPSVIMWSLGNEIPERITDKGLETAKYLKKEILKYDTTRLITAGVHKCWNEDHTEMLPLDKAFEPLDVCGYNYMWRFYETDHEQFPERIMFGSESVAKEASENWDKVEELPYVIGDFIWTAMDYLGEAGLGNSIEIDPEENVHQFMGWPWFNGWCGDLDLLGIKKPQSYYRDILWRERAISMAVEKPIPEGKIRKVSFWGWPDESLSWTFPDRESQPLKVNIYTRAPAVRLYLNDTVVAEKETDSYYTAQFEVPYQPGVLKAVELDGGKEGETTMLETVGEPVALRLVADHKTLNADGQDLAYVLVELVDAAGNVVCNTGRQLQVSCTGSGRIIGSGNASPTDMESFGSLSPKLFNGRAMAIVRAGYEQGTITLTISSEGLTASTATLEVK